MPKKDPINARDEARIDKAKADIAGSTQKALWAFRFVWNQQTDTEKFTGVDSGVRDHKGFQPHTTESMNDLYETLKEQNWLLSAAQCDRLRTVMPSYAKQILRLTGRIRNPYAEEERKAS